MKRFRQLHSFQSLNARGFAEVSFCLFAEDVHLLEHRDFREIVEEARKDRDRFVPALSTLLNRMNEGGLFGAHRIPLFNGRLFEVNVALPLPEDAFEALWEVSELSWSEIDPAIFGTLFERGMNPGKANLVGRHYTDPEKIRQIIRPVILNPLEAEWEVLHKRIAELMDKSRRAKNKPGRTRHRNAAQKLYGGFVGRLSQVTVLDPACGSGNFLYLVLQGLKDFEHRIGVDVEKFGLQRELSQIDPSNMYGIDIDDYAVRLARATIWIGHIQWMYKNGYGRPPEPILPPLESIECRDALIFHATTSNRGNVWQEVRWPSTEFIVGNPPFLGNKFMIGRLGEEYVGGLRAVFEKRVPRGADLVTYWFEKSRTELVAHRTKRVGLVTTNSIRGGQNRKVIERLQNDAMIFDAWSDEEWNIDGAAVRVSLICFAPPDDAVTESQKLNGDAVSRIHSDLTPGDADRKVDLTQAKRLAENRGVCFQGTIKVGAFDIPGEIARQWLGLPANPHGRPNSDVVRPWMNGRDITARPSDTWIVDFGTSLSAAEAALYEQPFKHVLDQVKPVREGVRRAGHRNYWWRFGEARPGLRRGLDGLRRYIAIPRVAKHLLPTWLDTGVVPDCQLVVITRDDEFTFGILSSRIHRVWAARKGTRLGVGNDLRYTPTTTFDTFPFPKGLRLNVDPGIVRRDSRAKPIADAAQILDDHRFRWLNPPEWVQVVNEVVPEFRDRLMPKSDETAELLKERTLTKLYNDPPPWLLDLHRALDEAVAAAYGWSPDISDDEILHRLLDLNLARAQAAEEASPEQLSLE